MRARYLLWIGAPLLILLAGIGFLVTTQSGLTALMALAGQLAPGSLSYERVQGRLIGPLSVTDLQYRNDELALSIGDAQFDWRPSELLSARLHVARLEASDIDVRLPPPAPQAEPFALSDIRLPVQLQIDDVDVSAIQVQPAGPVPPVLIDRVRFTARTEDQALVLTKLQVRTPDAGLTMDGRLEPVGAYPLTVNLKWSYRVPELGPLTGQGSINGNLQELSVTQELSGAVTAALDASVRGVLEEPAWSGKLTLSGLDLGKVSPDLAGSTLAARLQTQGNLKSYRASGELATKLPELGPVNAAFKVSGDPQALRVSELTLRAADKPMGLDLHGELALAGLQLDAAGEWRALAWPLTGTPQVQSPKGEFSLQGTPQDYRLKLDSTLAGPEFGKLQAQIEATGTQRAVRVSKLALSAPGGELALNAQAELSFADLGFEASGEWRSLAWPLAGTPQVQSPRGTFQASGNLQDYQFKLDTSLQGANVPAGDWKLRGRGSSQALEDLSLDARLLEGQLKGEAKARWQPRMSWQATLSGSGLNPGVKWPQLPGKLKFALRSSGELSGPGNTPQARLELDEFSGRLGEQDVRGKAELAINGQDLTLQALDLRAGSAALEASGTLAQAWDLRWQLRVPKLGALLPAAAGSVSGSGTLGGSRDKPRAQATLAVDDLAYATEEIRRLRVEANVDLSGAARSRLDVSGSDLRLGGQAWQRLTVAGAGTPAAHRLEATAAGEAGRFTLALEGELSGGALWQGRLDRLSAADTALGTWTLESPVALRASASEALAERACLRSRPSRVCIQGRWNAKTGAEGQLSLERLNLARFEKLLPPDVTVDANLDGEAAGSRRPDGALQGKVDFRLSSGRLRMVANGNPLQVAVQGGYLRAGADGGDASGQLRIDLGKTGELNADLKVRDFTGQAQVAGTVRAGFNDLALVSAFAPQIQNASGTISANLDLSGNLPGPQLRGAVRLTDGAAEVPEIGTQMKDIQLTAASSGGETSLRVSGSARSGAGRIDLAGQLDPMGRTLELTVKGKDFQAANTSQIQVVISPDMSVRMNQGQVRVEGEIRIPKAYLSSPDVSSGVSASPDVVIVKGGEGEPGEARQQGLAIFAAVRIILGKDVRVEAAGFKGKLAGNLLVQQTPQLPPRASGSIEVEAGKYRIYGQELAIDRGRVLYSGGPIDNPGLDLRVARQVDTVTAGAEVGGTLKRPELHLFSDPTMPDSSILSYVLFGRPPDARSGSENELLLAAASALGMSGGNFVTKRLKDAFGLDYFRFESGASNTGASLVVGKYLSPDLYVGYGVGLFEALNTFTLRYHINKRLSFESSSTGADSGGDLLYTIER